MILPERDLIVYYNIIKLNIIINNKFSVAPKVAPFFIRCGTGGVILLICTHLHNEGQE